MRCRWYIFFFFLLLPVVVAAQTFYTGKHVKKKDYGFGFEPLLHSSGPSKGFNFMFYSTYGVKRKMQWNGRLAGGSTMYLGSDLSWKLGKGAAFSTGAHYFEFPGLDFTFNLNLPLNRSFRLITGLDADVEFGDSVTVPIWLPIGYVMDITINTFFFMQAGIAVADPAFHYFGAGLVIFYY